MNGSNHRHKTIFATVRPSPHRPSVRSGKLLNEQRGIRSFLEMRQHGRRSSAEMLKRVGR